MTSSDVGQMIRRLREERSLSRAAVAERAGISSEALRSYEYGRRPLEHETIEHLADAMNLGTTERVMIFDAAGDSPYVGPLWDARARTEGTAHELARYEWTTLLMSDRHEILGWNWLANAIAEADLAELVPTVLERNLIWLAALEHIDRRLTNWDEIIGRLVTILRYEGISLNRGLEPPAYLSAIMARLAAHRPEVLQRFVALWFGPDAWHEPMRNFHPIRWRLADGTDLAFVGMFREWSGYDGIAAFDWMAADRQTSAWYEGALKRTGRGASVPGIADPKAVDFGQALNEARQELRVSRRQLAELAKCTPGSVQAYERGERRPRSRDTVLALARALTVDSYTMNVWLESLGFKAEPSDYARALMGFETRSHMRRSVQIVQPGPVERRAEIGTIPWPSWAVSSTCEIEGASPSGRSITGVQLAPGEAGVHLVEFMTSDSCRERMENWSEVARTVIPEVLRPFVLGAHRERPSTEFRERMRELRRRDPAAVEALLDAWDTTPAGPAPLRIAVPIEWRAGTGDLLRFHCFVAPWNPFDVSWAVDWHPANDTAWDAVERAEARR